MITIMVSAVEKLIKSKYITINNSGQRKYPVFSLHADESKICCYTSLGILHFAAVSLCVRKFMFILYCLL